MTYFQRIITEDKDLVVMVDSLKKRDISEYLMHVGPEAVIKTVDEVLKCGPESKVYKTAKRTGIVVNSLVRLCWIDYKDYVAFVSSLANHRKPPIEIEPNLDVSDYIIDKSEAEGLPAGAPLDTSFGFKESFLLLSSKEEFVTLPPYNSKTNSESSDKSKVSERDVLDGKDKKHFFRKVNTDKGDFVIIYSFDIQSVNLDGPKKNRLDFLKEDLEYALSEDKTREIVSLILNSDYTISFNEDISWIKYEDYVKFITCLRVVNPYVTAPIELDKNLVVKPVLTPQEKVLVDKLFVMINSKNKIEVLPEMNVKSKDNDNLEQDEIKKDETASEDEIEVSIDYAALKKEVEEELQVVVRELNYRRVGELRQHLAVLEFAHSQDNLSNDEKVALFEYKADEAGMSGDYISRTVFQQLANLLKKKSSDMGKKSDSNEGGTPNPLANESDNDLEMAMLDKKMATLREEIEKAQEEGNFERAAKLMQKLAILSSQVEKEATIDYDSMISIKEAELQEAMKGNVTNAIISRKINELQSQLDILKNAKEIDGWDYESKIAFFEEKIKMAEERNDYVSRASWLHLRELLEQTKNKCM